MEATKVFVFFFGQRPTNCPKTSVFLRIAIMDSVKVKLETSNKKELFQLPHMVWKEHLSRKVKITCCTDPSKTLAAAVIVLF